MKLTPAPPLCAHRCGCLSGCKSVRSSEPARPNECVLAAANTTKPPARVLVPETPDKDSCAAAECGGSEVNRTKLNYYSQTTGTGRLGAVHERGWSMGSACAGSDVHGRQGAVVAPRAPQARHRHPDVSFRYRPRGRAARLPGSPGDARQGLAGKTGGASQDAESEAPRAKTRECLL
jgi:hypothetical protein